MTTAVKAGRRATGTSGPGAAPRPADVLVAFGITGDLAKQMTLRSLYRLERRGLLRCPIVGVAVDDWTVDDLRERAREAIEAGGEPLDPEVFDRFAARLSYLSGDFADPDDLHPPRGGAQGRAQPRLLPGDPPVPVRRGGQGPGRRGADRGRARGRREAVRPRPRVGPRARRGDARVPRRVAALPDRPLPGQDGPRRDPLPAVRERDARAGLEPQLPGLGADHDGRELRRGGPRALLRPGRRAARRRREPHDAGRRRGRDGGPGGPRPDDGQGRRRRPVQGHARRRPGAVRARPVRRLPRDPRRGAGLHDRDLRGDAARDRQLALVGRAVLPAHRQAAAGHPDRAAARVPAPAPARLPRRRRAARARPADRQARPHDRGPASCSTAQHGDPPDVQNDPPRHGVRRRGRRGPGAVRGAAARGHAGRRIALHAPGRRGGGVARDGSRCSRPRRRCTRTRRGSWGPPAGGPARRRTAGTGTSRGWRHEPLRRRS